MVEPEQRGERRVWLRKEAQLSVVFTGYPAPNLRSEDAYPLEILSTVLSGGRTSRLYRRLVYEQRLALEAGGDYPRLTLDPDTFTFYVTVLPGRTVEEAERALSAEVERLRTELISEEELQRAQNQLEAADLFGQDSVFSRLGDACAPRAPRGLAPARGIPPRHPRGHTRGRAASGGTSPRRRAPHDRDPPAGSARRGWAIAPYR